MPDDGAADEPSAVGASTGASGPEPQPAGETGTASESDPDYGWTPERRRLHEWLLREASHLAPVYEASVRMMSDRDFPGRVWFVAHALRDIRNRLPAALAGTT
jgi:hypothetical protein